MTASISQTDEQVFTGLRAWILSIVSPDTQVIQADDNRVPPPDGKDYVLMQRITSTRLATNETSYTDEIALLEHLETYTEAIDYSIQIDAYGPNSADQMRALAMLFRSDSACSFLEPYAMQPLYLDEPHHVPFIDGEEEYEHRWITTAHIEINPSVSIPMEFMDAATVQTVSVDATYPPE